MTQRDRIREYCDKHPDMPTLTLARMIYNRHKASFTSLVAVRHRISRLRGKRPHNGRTKDKRQMVHTTVDSSTVPYAYRAPKSMADDHTEYVIHGAQRILRLSDIHFPFHDREALDIALAYGVKHDPTLVLLAGDIADLPTFSNHPKLHPMDFIEQEMLMLSEFFEGLRMMFPKARIVWMEGNHCVRFKRYLMQKAPELWGVPNLDVPGLVCAYGGPQAMSRIEWVDDCRVVRTGHLAHLHGHEFRGGGGVNPARWLFLKAGENAICGHFHRTSEHSEPSLSGKQRGAWTTGCLCTLKPDWMRHTKWNHGFAWIDVEQDGNFRVKNIRIVDGKIR